MWAKAILSVALCVTAVLPKSAPAAAWDFEQAAAGKLPNGWSTAKTGQGKGSVWQIVEDASAPRGPKVLAQVSSDGPNALFNLCVAEETSFGDLDLSVAMRPVAGKIDQGGGLVWRYQDADNYYVVRLNPLETNYRLYKVEGGKRTQLGTADVKAPTGEWHHLRVDHQGKRILCYLNGKLEIEVEDEAFNKPGKIGLWTKADAQSRFDDLQAEKEAKVGPLAKSPSQVLVVNTQDGSISLVDLDTQREVKRLPVGQRPYGIAVNREGNLVAVGVEDEEQVKFFSWPGFESRGAVKIGKMHNDHLVLTADGKQMVLANFYSDDVVGIDVATRKEAFRVRDCSAPHVAKYGPLQQNIYVTCKKVTGIAIIDPAAKKLIKFHQTNVNPRSLTFSPDEKKVYFGSFWVNGFFELETETGRVTRLFALPSPRPDAAPQEVTYHGVEAVGNDFVLAANEGYSSLDAVNVSTGKLVDRLTDVANPCCVERIPSPPGAPVRVLVSNLGDSTLQVVEVAESGKLTTLGKIAVGKGPKRVAFLPIAN